ncbi:hypothetical protein BJV82DRAFT_588197 [Fennellomyces sp. T-0311]|nr:hypothetical protein BJV82DRAFT_588197 [Fennellomyces sp. T-0311]
MKKSPAAMQSQSFPLLSPLEEQQQSVESLNQLMDPISFLTETEMQQDLDFFANTQFSYDVPPPPGLNDGCWSGQYCYDQTTDNCDQALPSPTSPDGDKTKRQQPTTPLSQPETMPQQLPAQKLTKDDKRKRNTAASARFRVKKKMREQALQRTAYEMTEKSKRLEAHIQDLEREIKWLKALVVEKSEGRLEQLINERPIPTAHHYGAYPPMPQPAVVHDDDDEDDNY